MEVKETFFILLFISSSDNSPSEIMTSDPDDSPSKLCFFLKFSKDFNSYNESLSPNDDSEDISNKSFILILIESSFFKSSSSLGESIYIF